MRRTRRFTLPIDPWPRESLVERMAVWFVLMFLLLVPCCAVGAACVLAAAVVLHVTRSYGVGTAIRAFIDRRLAGGAASAPRSSRALPRA